MSEKIKNIQVQVPEKLYKKVKSKMLDADKTWPEILLPMLKRYVKKKKKST